MKNAATANTVKIEPQFLLMNKEQFDRCLIMTSDSLENTNRPLTAFSSANNKARQLALGLAVRSNHSKYELIIDNFAGGGGASTGIEQAFGRPVDIAINHDGEALSMHTANHPETAHYKEDVFDIHPGFITGQRPIALAWFSPDCKHHSKAKGGKPREKKIRGLAWVTLKWGAFQMPRCIALENVEEFADWGPIDDDGKVIKSQKGRTFHAFVDALSTGLAKDHPDVPEICEALGVDFPMHRLYAGLGYKVEYKILRACDYGTPTIRKRLFVFARRDGLPIRWPSPTHGNPKLPGFAESGLKPWRTAADCIDWSIQCPSIFERKRPLGVVTATLAPFITEHANASTQRNFAPDEPLRTQCAEVKGGHFAAVTAILTHYHADKSPGDVRASEMSEPLKTQTTENRHALVTAFLAQHNKERNGVKAGRSADEPISTVTAAGSQQSLIIAHIQRDMGNSVGNLANTPLGTITAGGGGKSAVVATQLHPVNSPKATLSSQGPIEEQAAALHMIDEWASRPENVDQASREQQASTLIKLRGTSSTADIEDPLGTVSAGGLHHAEVRAFLIKYYSEGGQWQDPRDPMHTVPTKDRIGVVTIKGEDYAIVDIGMRMLTPRELARAQGFPDSYILDPIVNGKPLSKTAQVRMIGNSVCPPIARALLEANMTHKLEIAREVAA